MCGHNVRGQTVDDVQLCEAGAVHAPPAHLAPAQATHLSMQLRLHPPA